MVISSAVLCIMMLSAPLFAESDSTLSFTPFEDLNRSEVIESDSHVEDYRYSDIKPILYTDIVLDSELGLNGKPGYPRIRKITEGKYMLAWQIVGDGNGNGKDIYYAFSDNLKDWTPMSYLFKSRKVTDCRGLESTRYYSCPEMIYLRDGRVMATGIFWNPSVYNRYNCRRDHGVVVRFSEDEGNTWSEEKVIAYNQSWEPFLLQLPDGKIQCYFTYARSWISSGHSGTHLVESSDGGRTWSPEPEKAGYRIIRKGYWYDRSQMTRFTDQMPTGILLNNRSRIVCAMEDYDPRGYSLGVIYSPLGGEWKHLEGMETGPSERKDSVAINATGPYIAQFPSGETIVTFTRNKGLEWPLLYLIGSSNADDFSEERKAFNRGGWAGIDIDSPHTIVMAAPYAGNKLHICRFALNHSIRATKRTIVPDGLGGEWTPTDEALFLNTSASNHATIRCSEDDENIYFLAEVVDDDIRQGDTVTLMVNGRKFSASAASHKNGYGYSLEFVVPRSIASGNSIDFNAVLVNGEQTDYLVPEGKNIKIYL